MQVDGLRRFVVDGHGVAQAGGVRKIERWREVGLHGHRARLGQGDAVLKVWAAAAGCNRGRGRGGKRGDGPQRAAQIGQVLPGDWASVDGLGVVLGFQRHVRAASGRAGNRRNRCWDGADGQRHDVRHLVRAFVVPGGVANVHLVHHMVPFAAGQGVVAARNLGVFGE